MALSFPARLCRGGADRHPLLHSMLKMKTLPPAGEETRLPLLVDQAQVFFLRRHCGSGAG